MREAMSEEMRRDQRIFLMGEEVAQYQGAYKISQGMLEEFHPGTSTALSARMASQASRSARRCTGSSPSLVMSWSFSLVAADQILNNVPKMLYMSGGRWGCPIVFRGNDGAGGQLGSTHSWCVEGLYANVPGMKIAIPSCPYDAKGLLKTAIRELDPVFFLERADAGRQGPRARGGVLHPLRPGALRREGDASTVVSFGRPVNFCLEAADELAAEGIMVDVLDMRTIRPLDIDSIVRGVQRPGESSSSISAGPSPASQAKFARKCASVALITSTTSPCESTPKMCPRRTRRTLRRSTCRIRGRSWRG